jgi:hypothetical protein
MFDHGFQSAYADSPAGATVVKSEDAPGKLCSPKAYREHREGIVSICVLACVADWIGTQGLRHSQLIHRQSLGCALATQR